jgi:hypothetical protein
MTEERPFLDSVLWLDIKSIPRVERVKIKDDLTVHSRYADDGDLPVKFWVKKDGWIGLPAHYGLHLAKRLGLRPVDGREEGKRVMFRKLPTPRNTKQGKFFATLHAEAYRKLATFAVAPTGTGKTVAALNAIAKLGRAGLVIVPSKSLAAQWKKEAMLHLGLPSSAVHIFQQGKCAWAEYRIVIAVIHNLCGREWPEEFYSYFGTVVWDEGHRVGSRVFSESIMMFPARHRILLTATPTRKDGMDALIHAAFGHPDERVKGNKMQPLPADAYVIDTYTRIVMRSSGNRNAMSGMMISAVAACEPRNLVIAHILLDAYLCGRTILVISDRISQLKYLRETLVVMGADAEDLGMFIGSMSEKAQEKTKADATVIFATYGMMKEGQDIPRLDMGMDVTPRATAVQMVGRVRREFPKKRKPIWVTFNDMNGGEMMKGITFARLKDFESCGVRVHRLGDKMGRIPY